MKAGTCGRWVASRELTSGGFSSYPVASNPLTINSSAPARRIPAFLPTLFLSFHLSGRWWHFSKWNSQPLRFPNIQLLITLSVIRCLPPSLPSSFSRSLSFTLFLFNTFSRLFPIFISHLLSPPLYSPLSLFLPLFVLPLFLSLSHYLFSLSFSFSFSLFALPFSLPLSLFLPVTFHPPFLCIYSHQHSFLFVFANMYPSRFVLGLFSGCSSCQHSKPAPNQDLNK